ncbi:lecithin retinol acyltransferase family protein [Patescibacteria group bacterium]|nr:lecithin retinol acyltransferase family protein [Patescibacteria group bacterium]
MSAIHQELAQGRWQKMSFGQQMGNIASEIARAKHWLAKGDNEQEKKSAERAHELLSLTIADESRLSYLKELTRLRTILADALVGAGQYNISWQNCEDYCLSFLLAE